MISTSARRSTRPFTVVSLVFVVLVAHAACSTEDSPPVEGLVGASSNDAGSGAATGNDANARAQPDGAGIVSDGSALADAAMDAPPPDPCAGRVVCENFENVAPGQAPGAPWSVQASKGSVKVDRTHAHSGMNALKVSIDATTSSDTYRQAMLAVKGAPLFPLKDNTVYGRFYLWTDRVPDESVHYTFAGGSGEVDGMYAVYNYGGMGGLMANYYKSSSPDPTDCWQTKNETFPTGAWKCVAFELDGKNNEMRFWLDGTEIPELHVLGNTKTDQTCTVAGVDGRWLAPTFDNIRVGWESYQHDVAGAHDAWIDDVILDDMPIACSP
jgi:hypothetical protein